MKHSGRARKAAFKLILISLIAVLAVWGIGTLTVGVATVIFAIALAIAPFLAVVWLIFAVFTLYFFRDPEAHPPVGANLILSPGHGKIDVIDTTTEPEFMGGECQRISMFLSVINIHVQNAPVGGKIVFFKYTMGQFLNAIRTECASCNENVMIGFEAAEPRAVKIGVRLIAGVI